jgi:membrane-associated phospholipid phosphatase
MRAGGPEDPGLELDARRWAVVQAADRAVSARKFRAIRLPRVPLPLIDRRLRGPAVAGGALLLSGLFMVPARLHLGEPTILDRSVVDERIPFLEWTIWIYASYYLFLILAILLPRDDKLRSDAGYGLLLAGLIGLIIFTLWPTSVPRQSPDFSGATGFLWRLLFAVDTSVNALPSLHVANTCLAAPALAARGRVWRVIVPVWAASIIVSTLTTKQHYAIDVPGGLLLAAVCCLVVRFSADYRRVDGLFPRFSS